MGLDQSIEHRLLRYQHRLQEIQKMVADPGGESWPKSLNLSALPRATRQEGFAWIRAAVDVDNILQHFMNTSIPRFEQYVLELTEILTARKRVQIIRDSVEKAKQGLPGLAEHHLITGEEILFSLTPTRPTAQQKGFPPAEPPPSDPLPPVPTEPAAPPASAEETKLAPLERPAGLRLSSNQAKLLDHFLQNPGKNFNRSELSILWPDLTPYEFRYTLDNALAGVRRELDRTKAGYQITNLTKNKRSPDGSTAEAVYSYELSGDGGANKGNCSHEPIIEHHAQPFTIELVEQPPPLPPTENGARP